MSEQRDERRSMKIRYQLIVVGSSLAVACGASTPVTPSAAAAAAAGSSAFVGTWVPNIAIDSCTGSHACIALDSTWFVLRLAAEGSRIRGSGYVGGTSMDVDGSVDPTGDLVITSPSTSAFSLDELRLRTGSTGLTGTLRYRSEPMTVQGHITSARRGPLEPTQLNAQGTWQGNSVVRSCTFIGLTACPLPNRIFRLSLAQSGATVSGNLDLDFTERFRIPVRGQLTASTLTLEGTASRLDFGNTLQLRLIAWTSHTDAFGRMTGTYTLEQELIQTNYRSSTHYESELQDVYMLPDWFQSSSVTRHR